MIFHETWQQVLDGTKTQTRRLVKNNEYVWTGPNADIVEVCDSNNCLKWRVGNTYAVQPGRGKHAIGRIGIVKIRKEKLQEISYEDIGAEGLTQIWPVLMNTAYLMTGAKDENELKQILFRAEFAGLWDSIHPKGKRWEDNPEVWILEFELAND